MSVAHRSYWHLVDTGLESEFIRWIRDAYPLLFKELYKQFDRSKSGSATSKE